MRVRERDADIVVVGAGNAAMCAALSAREHAPGKKVRLVTSTSNMPHWFILFLAYSPKVLAIWWIQPKMTV